MSLRPTLRALAALSGVISALACAHCGSSNSEAATLAEPAAAGSSQKAGDAATDLADETTADTGARGATAPNAPPKLDDGLLLVNATRAFSAFRVCPATGSGLASTSLSRPIPTTLMPESSLAGVDINGAARIDPQVEFGNADEVVLLAIDDDTKVKDPLTTASCRALACVQNGGGCLGAAKVFRVPVRDPATKAKVAGAFSGRGKVLALRDDGELRFEVFPIANRPSTNAAQLGVELRNLSDFKGDVTYLSQADAKPVVFQGASASGDVDLTRNYSVARFTAGQYSATLLDIQQASDPRVPIDTFYKSPGSFALLLLGASATDASPGRPLRFLAVPVTAPNQKDDVDASAVPQDGGTD